MAARSTVGMVFATFLALAVLTPLSLAQAASPFGRLNGAWSGSGRVTFEGGQTERLRCSASYRSSDGGSRLGLSIRCASASNSIELRGDLTYNNGRVSGSWEERSTGASGSASGRADSDSVVLRFSGSASGTMSVALGGSGHTVSVSSQGTALRGINVSLGRR